jgi:hypothetical protein
MKGSNLFLESCILTLELCLFTQPGITSFFFFFSFIYLFIYFFNIPPKLDS